MHCKLMTVQKFVGKVIEAFGKKAPLPIALAYGNAAATEVKRGTVFVLEVEHYKQSKKMLATMNDSALYKKVFVKLYL